MTVTAWIVLELFIGIVWFGGFLVGRVSSGKWINHLHVHRSES